MIPRTRNEFKEFCLRKLGKPVISINASADQIDDRLDEALKYFADFHFDGTEKLYYKYQVTAADRPGKVAFVQIVDGGTGYSNTDTLAFTGGTYANVAVASIITNNLGEIVSTPFTDNGTDYKMPPTVTVTTSTGKDAILKAELGGAILMPENVIGAIRIFDMMGGQNQANMFGVRYQLMMNDLVSLTNQSIVPYYMTMQQLELIQQVLVGKKPIRYNRHRNVLYVDMDWQVVNPGEWLVVECYQVVDPEEYTDIWSDRWLQRYCTAKIKMQWGENLKKFTGMQLPGGIQFNGQKIWDEAYEEINMLENAT